MNAYPAVQGRFLGVCSWLANSFGVDVSIVRLIFVITTIFGVGSPILFYFGLAIVKAIL